MTDDQAWPPGKLSALRLGRRLAVEVPASSPQRRAFVDIAPGKVEADTQARREGWQHRSAARRFTVQHWEYDAELVDGFDYDVGATLVREAVAADESALLDVLAQWQLNAQLFQYSWDTANPR